MFLSWRQYVHRCPSGEVSRGDTITYEYMTPVGTLVEERKRSGKTIYRSKYLLRSVEDIKVYQYIVEHTSYQPCFDEFWNGTGLSAMMALQLPRQSNSNPELLQHLMGVRGLSTTCLTILRR